MTTRNPAATAGEFVPVPGDGTPVVTIVAGAGNDYHPSIRKP